MLACEGNCKNIQHFRSFLNYNIAIILEHLKGKKRHICKF